MTATLPPRIQNSLMRRIAKRNKVKLEPEILEDNAKLFYRLNEKGLIPKDARKVLETKQEETKREKIKEETIIINHACSEQPEQYSDAQFKDDNYKDEQSTKEQKYSNKEKIKKLEEAYSTFVRNLLEEQYEKLVMAYSVPCFTEIESWLETAKAIVQETVQEIHGQESIQVQESDQEKDNYIEERPMTSTKEEFKKIDEKKLCTLPAYTLLTIANGKNPDNYKAESDNYIDGFNGVEQIYAQKRIKIPGQEKKYGKIVTIYIGNAKNFSPDRAREKIKKYFASHCF